MKTWKKMPSKVGHNPHMFFFSIANRPKTSPNFLFCLHKNISLCNFYKMTLVQCMYCLCNMIIKFWLTIWLFYFHIQPKVIRKDFILLEKRNRYFFEAHKYLVRFSVCFKTLSQPQILTIINNLKQIKTREVKGKIQWNGPLPKLSALKYYSPTVV